MPLEVHEKVQELIRIGNRGVRQAQEVNRRCCISNVCSINGILYNELPNGELTREDPFKK